MAGCKYRVGQMVDFNPSPADVTASVRKYKILRLLPRQGAEQRYRIKTITEPFDRIATESEIVPASAGSGPRSILQFSERQKSIVPLASPDLETHRNGI